MTWSWKTLKRFKEGVSVPFGRIQSGSEEAGPLWEASESLLYIIRCEFMNA